MNSGSPYLLSFILQSTKWTATTPLVSQPNTEVPLSAEFIKLPLFIIHYNAYLVDSVISCV